jgi:hypothetical protein
MRIPDDLTYVARAGGRLVWFYLALKGVCLADGIKDLRDSEKYTF